MTDSPSPEALERHDEACAAGEPGYTDPDRGLFVMTAVYLHERGYCCGSGCRHCPYSEAEQLAAGRPDVPSWPGCEGDA